MYKLLTLQADPSPPNPGLDSVSLHLHLRGDIIWQIKLVQDCTDTSIMSGFWTFVNGSFAMFFEQTSWRQLLSAFGLAGSLWDSHAPLLDAIPLTDLHPEVPQYSTDSHMEYMSVCDSEISTEEDDTF
ncbi:hypothetical protein B0H10DRAFT_1963738 [Mycena sp. CBHHK59/15]|nr:hypothetical protein B0H10DRAFT_1963738 [Mycena sp. CBHHK59/15]